MLHAFDISSFVVSCTKNYNSKLQRTVLETRMQHSWDEIISERSAQWTGFSSKPPFKAGCDLVTQIYLLFMKEIKSRKKELTVQLGERCFDAGLYQLSAGLTIYNTFTVVTLTIDCIQFNYSQPVSVHTGCPRKRRIFQKVLFIFITLTNSVITMNT